MKKNGFNDALKYLALLSQLAITLLTPVALFIMGALFLTRKYGIGTWIVIVGIVLGILSGGMSAYNLAMKISKQKK